MRRVISLCLSVWLALGMCLIAAAQQLSSPEWYKHAEDAYRFQIPVGWRVQPILNERHMDIIAPSADSPEMLICDRQSTNLASLTTEQALLAFELSLKQETDQQKIKRSSLGGMPAVMAAGFDRTTHMASFTVVVLANHRSYQLSAMVPSNVMLDEPPSVIRTAWDSIEWLQLPPDTANGQPQKETPTEVDVCVAQQTPVSAVPSPPDTLWSDTSIRPNPLNQPAFRVDEASLAWSSVNMLPGIRSQLTSLKEAMRLLYGPMNTKQAEQFEAKWSPYYGTISDDIEQQIRKLSPIYGQMVVARAGFAQSAREYFRQLTAANIGRISGYPRQEADSLRLCQYAQTMMIAYQACIESLQNKALLIGDLAQPQPQQDPRAQYQAAISAIYKFASLSNAGDNKQQISDAQQLHVDYLMNMQQCFKDARSELTSQPIPLASVQSENWRRIVWVDFILHSITDELGDGSSSRPMISRTLFDDLCAQSLMVQCSAEANKTKRVMDLLQIAVELQRLMPLSLFGDVELEWRKHITPEVLAARNPEPIMSWINQLAGQVTAYWQKNQGFAEAPVQLNRVQQLLQRAQNNEPLFGLGLSDVPISGLGTAGTVCWGADDTTMAAFYGAQGYEPGGLAALGQTAVEWSSACCRQAQFGLESWSALPGAAPSLKTASELLTLSKCFDFASTYVGKTGKPKDLEADSARFKADLQQGKSLADAYSDAEQQLTKAQQLGLPAQQQQTRRSAAQQLAASVMLSTAAKVILQNDSPDTYYNLLERIQQMNAELMPQVTQSLSKLGYQADQVQFRASGTPEGSINWQMSDPITACMCGKQPVSLYRVLQDARESYYQSFEATSQYGGEHGSSAKSGSLPPESLLFAAALTQNIVKQSAVNNRPMPIKLMDDDDLSRPVEVASYKMALSADTSISTTQEQCRQLNRDISLKLIPWLEQHAPQDPQTLQYFRKLQVILERASRKTLNPGLLYQSTQELGKYTGGIGVEQLSVDLNPVWDTLAK